jgi:hypothetical protein
MPLTLLPCGVDLDQLSTFHARLAVGRSTVRVLEELAGPFPVPALVCASFSDHELHSWDTFEALGSSVARTNGCTPTGASGPALPRPARVSNKIAQRNSRPFSQLAGRASHSRVAADRAFAPILIVGSSAGA